MQPSIYQKLNLTEWIPSLENIPDITRRLLWGGVAVGAGVASYKLEIPKSSIPINSLIGLISAYAANYYNKTQTLIDGIGMFSGGIIAGAIKTTTKATKNSLKGLEKAVNEITNPRRR